MDYRELWKDEYRGVTYEVAHWRLGWNYYLYIPAEQLPNNMKPKFNLRARTYKLSPDGDKHTSYDAYKAPIISNLDWHGSITLYEKIRNEQGNIIGYRLGCDYMHLFDEGRTYSLDYVASEARHSIDKLWEYVYYLKVRCAWNGRYYDASQTYVTDKGVSVALENKPKWEGRLDTVSQVIKTLA